MGDFTMSSRPLEQVQGVFKTPGTVFGFDLSQVPTEVLNRWYDVLHAEIYEREFGSNPDQRSFNDNQEVG